MMTKTHRKARGGAAGVYLEGDRVSTRPDGPLLARVAELMAQKYSQRAYNERR